MSVHRLKVTLADIDPPIWRRLEVPSEFSLEELAQVLLAAFGWDGSHLHQFEQGRTTWAPPHEEDEWYESAVPVIDTNRVRLREMRKSRKPLLFVYDLGDCWTHVLEIEEVDPSKTAAVARCLAGERSAPPEDCGGVSGHARLLEILEDPKHPEYGEMKEWVGPHFQPERIDVGEINEVLAMLRTAPEIEAPRAAAKIGRNDPCPCGSGKKYKKCHLGSEAGSARTPLQVAAEFHALDKKMFEKVAGWAKRRYPAHEWAAASAAAYGQVGHEEVELVAQWMFFHAETPAGMSLTDEYLAAHREKDLHAVEEAWCESQGLAWLSAWEVVDVEVGRSLGLRDLLTGEERLVAEKAGSETLPIGYAILGRVVDTDGISVLAGMHGYGALPTDAVAFVKDVRRSLRKKKLAPQHLRSQDATVTLLRRWRKIFSDRANAPLPAMTNTSGEPLLMTTDHFALVRAEPAEIRRRLEILPGAEKGKPNEIVFVDNEVVVAVVTLKAKTLEIVSNSTARADVWRNRVELVCKEFVRFRVRETSDPVALVEQNRKSGAKPLPREEHAENPEIDARVREIKATHYRQWLDEKIPALGGQTPRAAAKGKRRGALETLLKEMEILEAQLPPSQRADLRFLREELGFNATGKPPKGTRAPRS